MAGFLKSVAAGIVAGIATVGMIGGAGYVAYMKLVQPKVDALVKEVEEVKKELQDTLDEISKKMDEQAAEAPQV